MSNKETNNRDPIDRSPGTIESPGKHLLVNRKLYNQLEKFMVPHKESPRDKSITQEPVTERLVDDESLWKEKATEKNRE